MGGIVQDSLLGVSIQSVLEECQVSLSKRTRKGNSQAALFIFKDRAMVDIFLYQQWYCSCLDDEA